MTTTISRKSKFLLACAVWATLVLVGQLPAAGESRDRPNPFETSGRAGLTQEGFSAATPDQRARWVGGMWADLKLDAPQNVKAFEILT